MQESHQVDCSELTLGQGHLVPCFFFFFNLLWIIDSFGNFEGCGSSPQKNAYLCVIIGMLRIT